MRQKSTFEIAFLLIVIAVSLVGFSSLLRGDQVTLNGYHILHVITSLAWLVLLLVQLVQIRTVRFDRHRALGRYIRSVHGALLMSTALTFLVIALVFTLISYIPGYRVEGPETFNRFTKSGQMAALIGAVIGLLFFLKNFRTGWPWILVSAFFFLNGSLQFAVAQSNRTEWLTRLVGSIGELPAFGLGLLLFAGALWMTRRDIPRAVAAHSPDSF